MTVPSKLVLLNNCKQVIMLANGLTNYAVDFLIWHMVSVQDAEDLPVTVYTHGPKSVL